MLVRCHIIRYESQLARKRRGPTREAGQLRILQCAYLQLEKRGQHLTSTDCAP